MIQIKFPGKAMYKLLRIFNLILFCNYYVIYSSILHMYNCDFLMHLIVVYGL